VFSLHKTITHNNNKLIGSLLIPSLRIAHHQPSTTINNHQQPASTKQPASKCHKASTKSAGAVVAVVITIDQISKSEASFVALPLTQHLGPNFVTELASRVGQP
jgi:hypothetical protein